MKQQKCVLVAFGGINLFDLIVTALLIQTKVSLSMNVQSSQY